jgi:hypothetical protein
VFFSAPLLRLVRGGEVCPVSQARVPPSPRWSRVARTYGGVEDGRTDCRLRVQQYRADRDWRRNDSAEGVSSNLWWGLGCVLLPFIAPVFIFFNWRDTKKGFLIIVIGAVLYGGSYLDARGKTNRNVAEIKIVKVTMTTSLSDTDLPVSDLMRISRNEERVLLFVRLQVPPKHMYRFTGQMFDQSGRAVLDRTISAFPDVTVWNTWFYHSFDKLRDTPGQWRFV